MNVPFQLRKLQTPQAATAILLEGEDTSRLLELCVRLAAAHAPRLFRVAGGYLLCLQQPTATTLPGVQRLRGLAEHLLLPSDADLIPSLLAEEALALGRDRGLVFLPGGRVLAFDPRQPVALAAFLDAGPAAPRRWRPLPEAPALAEQLRSIRLELPADPAELLPDESGNGIGSEPPLPAEPGTAMRAISQVQASLGRGLLGLGNALGMKGMAAAGARMMQRALDRAPGLLERILGKQDAALRWLLHQFEAGNLEEALRRALPLNHNTQRGSTLAPNAGLPLNDMRYSLQELLGSRSGSPGYFLSQVDVLRRLQEEYRKAAEQAAARGDYRRAAFILGRLLDDCRAAANVLMRGGLYRDAALLLLMRVGDRHAAARAFALAGEFDRALELYREVGDHLAAGDLLRQLGEEEAAVAAYRCAAAQLVTERRDYLAAGDLLLTRAHARAEAVALFRTGWRQRPDGSALPCALRLVALHAQAAERLELLTLLTEAEEFFTPPGNELSAGQFWNESARLGLNDALADLGSELRDRALRGLAHKLRQKAAGETRPGPLLMAFFGPSTNWTSAQVADAEYAWLAARKRHGLESTPRTNSVDSVVRLGYGTVTAVCHALQSGALFVGFENGHVALFYPSTGAVHYLPSASSFLVAPVVSLAVDDSGTLLAVLHGHHASPRTLTSYRVDNGHFASQASLTLPPAEAWLTTRILRGMDRNLLAMSDGKQLQLLEGSHLVAVDHLAYAEGGQPLSALLLDAQNFFSTGRVLLLEGTSLWDMAVGSLWSCSENLGWYPTLREGNTLRTYVPSWSCPEPNWLELAGVNAAGNLNWSQLYLIGGRYRTQARRTFQEASNYLAAALVRAGTVAAVSAAGVDWVRIGLQKPRCIGRTRAVLSGAVACFANHGTNELLVVCNDGTLVCVPIPT